MPKEVEEVRDTILFARLYNKMTGANITHWQLEEMGIIERERIVLAFDMLGLD